MKRIACIVMTLSAFGVFGCGRDASVSMSEPHAQPSPPAESDLTQQLPSWTNQLIDMGVIQVDDIHHISHETVILEVQTGDEVPHMTTPDMTLVDDRYRSEEESHKTLDATLD